MILSILKKDNTLDNYNEKKIIKAVKKSAERVMYSFSEKELEEICFFVKEKILEKGINEIPIYMMHNIVESVLEKINPEVAKSYKDYRNYKKDFVEMLDGVYQKAQSIMYIGDKENSNTDSALVSTKRSLIYGQLNKELYKKFFLTTDELQAINDGYIYIHDMTSRRDSHNCCLFDITTVLNGGFEMGNLWYNEPKTLDTAFDVIGDIILSTASQQYGGFTVPEIDTVLVKYAEKTYDKYKDEIKDDFYLLNGKEIDENKLEEIVLRKIERDIEQGFQGLEYKLNSVGSSRGDYPFVTFTLGLNTTKFGKMLSKGALKVHMKGQGKDGHKKPTLFPKYVFLYSEELHGKGKELEDVFEVGIECSSKTMYPDWLSLSGEGYVSEMYKKYGKAISPMG